jgi:membrane protease YdiL (CAAX protease family)
MMDHTVELPSTAAWRQPPIIAAVILWLAGLGVLASNPNPSLQLPVASGVLFGGLFSWLAYRLTRNLMRVTVEVADPRRSLMIQGTYLIIFSIVVLGWGLGVVADVTSSERERALAVGVIKVVTMALIPLLLLRSGGDAIAPLFKSRMPRRRLIGLAVAFSCIFLVVMALVTPSLSQLQQLQPTVTQVVAGIAITIIWVTLTAAVTEEVMFRGVLQTRLESVLSSAAACVVVGAIVFAVAHVPGLYLRGDQAAMMGVPVTLTNAIAYSITVLGPPGAFFGILWMRTRSLALLIVAHAAIDILPNLPEIIELWL